MNSMLLMDGYKADHKRHYPPNTTLVYSNMTPRKSRLPTNHMVVFGIQYFLKKYLIDHFDEHFFGRSREVVMAEYKRRIKTYMGSDLVSYKHIEDLHALGYLPIKIKALKEGTVVPMRVPFLTVVNTLPEFFWVTNFIETLMSSVIWQPCTSATISKLYKEMFLGWAEKTGMPKEFVQWQGHDFSFRGMSSPESAVVSGMGHLLSFYGTDTIPAIDGLEEYYLANADKEIIGGSVCATEHSCVCSGGEENEQATLERLITEVYPNGIFSMVSDSWDLFRLITVYLPNLKEKIMARDGKLVIRPDSGVPEDIICGKEFRSFEDFSAVDRYYRGNAPSPLPVFEVDGEYYKLIAHEGISLQYTDYNRTPEDKGVIELLWEVFGGTETATGYKLLNSHIGAIYGDSITLKRGDEICRRLAEKGFASQCVKGLGSYSFQYNTRDTLGLAMKATYCEVNGEGREIFKDPVTDSGMKKSAKGLIRVDRVDGELVLRDQVTKEEEAGGELEVVFENSKVVRLQSLAEIREILGKGPNILIKEQIK